MINADYHLKNCPCCGGYAHPLFEDFAQTVWIQCDTCGIRTGKYRVEDLVDGKSSGEQVLECWNRRVSK